MRPKAMGLLRRFLRSARLNRFLNVRHGWLMRWLAGAGGAAFVLLATRELALARETFGRLYRRGQFRAGMRRLSFYGRRSWLRLNLSTDPMFVFCSDLSVVELAAMRRFLQRRRAAHPPAVIASDLHYVSAMTVLADAGPEAMRTFANDTDAMLAVLDTPPPAAPDAPKDAPRFDTVQAAAALADFADCMARAGLPWFVLSGTFLGIVREGGFLPHDDDIDAGVMADRVSVAALLAALQGDARFHCNDLESLTVFEPAPGGGVQRVERPVFLKVGHRGGVHVDVFIHYREGGVIWHASSLFRWDNAAFDLVPYDLAGTKVLGPADADRYLTENYGAWRVPVTTFNSAVDTTNLFLMRNPLSLAIFLRRVWIMGTTQPEAAAAQLRLAQRGGFLRAGPEGRLAFDPAVFGGHERG